MFHVEHRGGDGLLAQGIRQFDAGNQCLLATPAQPFQNPALVVEVEFGAQIVQRDDGLLPAGVRVNAGVSQHAGQRAQLFLTARQMLAPGRLREPDRPVGTMRAAAGVTPSAIQVAALSQQLPQIDIVRPAAQPFNSAVAQFRQKLSQSFCKAQREPDEIVTAHAVHRFGRTLEFSIPDIQLFIAGALLEGSIALMQDAPIASGGVHEAVFHVEHTPIQEPPPLASAARNQFVASRLETNYGHLANGSTQLRRLGLIDACSPSGIFANQRHALFARHSHNCGRNSQALLAAANQVVDRSGAEALRVRKQEGGFEDAALAGTVGSDEDIQARCQRNIEVGDVAQIIDMQPGQPHE